MFRQDYRINKIFLPFHLPAIALAQARRAGKKGKKHHPSSREDVHSLRQQSINAREQTFIVNSYTLFSANAELRFLGFIWCFHKANAATREKKSSQSLPARLWRVNPVRKYFGFMSK